MIKTDNMSTHLNAFEKWKFIQSFIHLTKMVVLKMIDWARLSFKWELYWTVKMEIRLKKRRKDNRLILLYKGRKGKAGMPTDDFIPKTRRGRNQLSEAFQTPIANTDVYKCSFFPQTASFPQGLDADCVAKFTTSGES